VVFVVFGKTGKVTQKHSISMSNYALFYNKCRFAIKKSKNDATVLALDRLKIYLGQLLNEQVLTQCG